ncbi:hypothetical protein NC652_026447 [Populus alba x Populus x berolinensis]|nr:hypothetical protein NC652_026447 [Populus alba x Populus x berolinensis]
MFIETVVSVKKKEEERVLVPIKSLQGKVDNPLHHLAPTIELQSMLQILSLQPDRSTQNNSHALLHMA